MGHYLTLLLRNLRRERLYAAIHIAGLALGLACCLILGLFLRSELTYDQQYPEHESIYRIENEFVMSGRTQTFAITSPAFGPMIAAEYPQYIQAVVRLDDNSSVGGIALHRTDQPGKVFYWEHSFLADENLFDVFPARVIAGDPETALRESNRSNPRWPGSWASSPA